MASRRPSQDSSVSSRRVPRVTLQETPRTSPSLRSSPDRDTLTALEGPAPEETATMPEKDGGDVVAGKKEDEEADEPYTVFSIGRKRAILAIVTLCGFISPTTANITMSALPDMSQDLDVSIEAVTLTATVYMVFQALSPMFFASLTDTLGRKPLYIVCMAVFCGTSVGLALLPKNFAALLVLRGLQACGSASTISIGAGSIGDISQSRERGTFMGIFGAGSTAGPSVAPIVAGLLTQGFGWRSIFWFCFALGAFTLLLVVFFLPETLRKLVGNGGKPSPTLIHEALWDLMRGQTVSQLTDQPRAGIPPNPRLQGLTGARRVLTAMLIPLQPLKMLLVPELIVLLLMNSIPYACTYCITSSMADIFQKNYGLTTLQAGLVFLSPGMGSSVASYVSGKILDYDYDSCKEEEERWRQERPSSQQPSATAMNHAPGATWQTSPMRQPREVERIEYARFKRYPIYMLVSVATCVGYGWSAEYKVHMSVPIILVFIHFLAAMSIFTCVQVAIVDYFPNQGASVTSCNNLIRCAMGAVGTAVIQYMVNGLGAGRAFTIVAGLVAASSVLGLVLVTQGRKWRDAREEKLAQKAEDKSRQAAAAAAALALAGDKTKFAEEPLPSPTEDEVVASAKVKLEQHDTELEAETRETEGVAVLADEVARGEDQDAGSPEKTASGKSST